MKSSVDEAKLLVGSIENVFKAFKSENKVFSESQNKMRGEIKDFENLLDEFRSAQ